MYKYDSLAYLLSLGLNVHEFELINSYEKMQDYAECNPAFSMRFDSRIVQHNLPFYFYDNLHTNKSCILANNIK
jgi:hypothetical protein